MAVENPSQIELPPGVYSEHCIGWDGQRIGRIYRLPDPDNGGYDLKSPSFFQNKTDPRITIAFGAKTTEVEFRAELENTLRELKAGVEAEIASSGAETPTFSLIASGYEPAFNTFHVVTEGTMPRLAGLVAKHSSGAFDPETFTQVYEALSTQPPAQPTPRRFR